MAPFDKGQNKKQELPVKKSGSDGVAAGETVARPIDKRTIKKRPLPVNKNLYPFVQKHAAGNSDYKRDQRLRKTSAETSSGEYSGKSPC